MLRYSLACLLAIASLVVPAAAQRSVVDFDSGWRFHEGDTTGADAAAFDDGDWATLDVPHDWSIAGPFSEDAPATGSGGWLPTGVGWYRKAFDTPSGAERVFIEFDGVMANSDVWVNGAHLGKRPYGYVSFAYELTDHLNRDGRTNVVVVRADTSEQPASRWYAGAGIYRHVRLVATGATRIARNGVFVTTPEATAERARVEATVEVDGWWQAAEGLVVRAAVIGPDGEEVATAEAPVVDGAPAELSMTIDDPTLWSLNEPAMHRLATRLVCGGRTFDEVTTPFGVRVAEFRADTGFWLNGENFKLKGVCLHHDGGAFGAAVPSAVWERRLRKLKELGVNAVRTAHNPPAPELLDLCDRLGLAVMDEFFDCWTKGKNRHDYHKYFEEWWRRDLTESVRRDRNHPCVVLYSVGNEIRDMHDTEHAKETLTGLVDACHAADPTRPVTQALFRPNTTHDYDNGVADLLDVVGTNYRDAELLQAWRDDPTRKIIGTEQGHGRRTWLDCRDNPQHAGQFLWVGIDYLGESRRWPVTTFDTGLLDRTGAVYPRGGERQSWWSEEPMVRAYRRTAPTEATPEDPGYEEEEWIRRRVLFDDWTPTGRDPRAEQALPMENVEVYSNCAEVELFLNGESLGVKQLPRDAAPRNWRVPYRPGELVAVGRNGGKDVAEDRLRTSGKPARLMLTIERDTLHNDWEDVLTVEVTVVDAEGVRCPGANDNVAFSVKGPAEVVAVDNGSIVSRELFQASERRSLGGRCVAYVQATGDDGEFTVTASAEGLGEASVSGVVEPAGR